MLDKLQYSIRATSNDRLPKTMLGFSLGIMAAGSLLVACSSTPNPETSLKQGESMSEWLNKTLPTIISSYIQQSSGDKVTLKEPIMETVSIGKLPVHLTFKQESGQTRIINTEEKIDVKITKTTERTIQGIGSKLIVGPNLSSLIITGQIKSSNNTPLEIIGILDINQSRLSPIRETVTYGGPRLSIPSTAIKWFVYSSSGYIPYTGGDLLQREFIEAHLEPINKLGDRDKVLAKANALKSVFAPSRLTPFESNYKNKISEYRITKVNMNLTTLEGYAIEGQPILSNQEGQYLIPLTTKIDCTDCDSEGQAKQETKNRIDFDQNNAIKVAENKVVALGTNLANALGIGIGDRYLFNVVADRPVDTNVSVNYSLVAVPSKDGSITYLLKDEGSAGWFLIAKPSDDSKDTSELMRCKIGNSDFLFQLAEKGSSNITVDELNSRLDNTVVADTIKSRLDAGITLGIPGSQEVCSFRIPQGPAGQVAREKFNTILSRSIGLWLSKQPADKKATIYIKAFDINGQQAFLNVNTISSFNTNTKSVSSSDSQGYFSGVLFMPVGFALGNQNSAQTNNVNNSSQFQMVENYSMTELLNSITFGQVFIVPQ